MGQILSATCCVVGGGPAGMMAGFLLARAGIDVVVLEKHADFLRDFRGDTIHPSTIELMHELGLLDEFLKLPHQEARGVRGQVRGTTVEVADFSHLPTRCGFIVFMPQWDFLDFIARQAAQHAGFSLRQRAEAAALLEESGRIAGVRADTPDGVLDVRADLVIAADGRHSIIRALAGLKVDELGAPMDVLWFRLPRRPDEPNEPLGIFDSGRILVLIDRGDTWQCGYVVAKGSIERLRPGGVQPVREAVAKMAPFLADRTGEIRGWDDLKPLTVAVERLRQWYRPGLVCIGDAAHAMSPIGGVGINLAIQDAVAAANIIAEPLRARHITEAHLRQVQARREFPAKVTQALQVAIQKRVISPLLGRPADGDGRALALPLPLRLLARYPVLRRLPGRIIGLGVRPEHVKTRSA